VTGWRGGLLLILLAAAPPAALAQAPADSGWSVESGDLFWKTPNPFMCWFRNYRKNPLDYRFVPVVLTWERELGQGAKRGFFRGDWSGLVSGVFTDITAGPEHHWAGVAAGLQYNFHPLATPRLTPFVGWRGGVGGLDASHVRYGQERDLTFTYLIGIGFEYRIGRSASLIVQTLTQHISNGWQTHPSEGVDVTGPSLGLRWRR
jgi:hypothetical protein